MRKAFRFKLTRKIITFSSQCDGLCARAGLLQQVNADVSCGGVSATIEIIGLFRIFVFVPTSRPTNGERKKPVKKRQKKSET
jgi:hypothetical protein